LPVTARGIRVQVAADEIQLPHATLELVHRVGDRDSGRLRQLTDAGEVIRVEADDSPDQVVVGACPGRRYVFVPDVMAHRRGARGKEREIAAALSLQLELI